MIYAEFTAVEHDIPAQYSFLGLRARGPGLPARQSYKIAGALDSVYRILLLKESHDATGAAATYDKASDAEAAWGVALDALPSEVAEGVDTP